MLFGVWKGHSPRGEGVTCRIHPCASHKRRSQLWLDFLVMSCTRHIPFWCSISGGKGRLTHAWIRQAPSCTTYLAFGKQLCPPPEHHRSVPCQKRREGVVQDDFDATSVFTNTVCTHAHVYKRELKVLWVRAFVADLLSPPRCGTLVAMSPLFTTLASRGVTYCF